jgi:hypothetical protein
MERPTKAQRAQKWGWETGGKISEHRGLQQNKSQNNQYITYSSSNPTNIQIDALKTYFYILKQEIAQCSPFVISTSSLCFITSFLIINNFDCHF